MNKKIAIISILSALFGLTFVFICYAVGTLFRSMLITSLPSYLSLFSFWTSWNDFWIICVFFGVPIIQWFIFGYAVSSDLLCKERKIGISIIVGFSYILLCLLCSPFYLKNVDGEVGTKIYIILFIHIVIGLAVALLPIILTFREHSRLKKCIIVFSMMVLVSLFSLIIYLKNKPIPLYGITVKNLSSKQTQNIKIKDKDGIQYKLGTGYEFPIGNPIPKDVVITWEIFDLNDAEADQFDNDSSKTENIDKTFMGDMGDEEYVPPKVISKHAVNLEVKNKLPENFTGQIIFEIYDNEVVKMSYEVKDYDKYLE